MGEESLKDVIAWNIARQLERHGKTQQELAEYVGVSQATVSSWCNGAKMPRMAKVDLICEFFSISRSDLMGGQGDAPRDGTNAVTPDEYGLVERYRSLDRLGREAVDWIIGHELERIASQSPEGGDGEDG